MLEPSNVEFPLIQTNSEHVKKGLVEAARKHRHTLLEKRVNDYRQECQKLIYLLKMSLKYLFIF